MGKKHVCGKAHEHYGTPSPPPNKHLMRQVRRHVFYRHRGADDRVADNNTAPTSDTCSQRGGVRGRVAEPNDTMSPRGTETVHAMPECTEQFQRTTQNNSPHHKGEMVTIPIGGGRSSPAPLIHILCTMKPLAFIVLYRSIVYLPN